MTLPAMNDRGGAYSVERTGAQLPTVDLGRPTGTAEKTYKADAKLEHEPGRETVIEVEAGAGHANPRWRKDLMEACLMPYVDYLVIAVRSNYGFMNNGRPSFTQDFNIVTTELDALY